MAEVDKTLVERHVIEFIESRLDSLQSLVSQNAQILTRSLDCISYADHKGRPIVVADDLHQSAECCLRMLNLNTSISGGVKFTRSTLPNRTDGDDKFVDRCSECIDMAASHFRIPFEPIVINMLRVTSDDWFSSISNGKTGSVMHLSLELAAHLIVVTHRLRNVLFYS